MRVHDSLDPFVFSSRSKQKNLAESRMVVALGLSWWNALSPFCSLFYFPHHRVLIKLESSKEHRIQKSLYMNKWIVTCAD